MEIIYQDEEILVCIKPPRVLSTDETGGLPELIRQELGDLTADVRTVHRAVALNSCDVLLVNFDILLCK